MNNISLRKSQPSERELATSLIYSSGPPSFDYVFKNEKKSAIDFLNYAYMREGGEFSYDNHYSLYLNEEMVGIGSVFGAKRGQDFTLYEARNIICFYKFQCAPVIFHGLQIESLIKLPKKNEVALAHLAIKPDHQGKGLGTALINALMQTVGSRADKTFVLDVSEENPLAKKLYERLGFVMTKEMKSTLKNRFSYVANHYRESIKDENCLPIS